MLAQAAHLTDAWALMTRDGDVWELDWYIQRLRTLDFLGGTLLDTLERIGKMQARLRDSRSPQFDANRFVEVQVQRQAVETILLQVRDNLARMRRPGPPVDYDQIATWRKQFDINQAEDLVDIISRVTAVEAS